MLNLIWLVMILIGIIVAIFTGQSECVLTSAIEAAEAAVRTGLQLAGIMAFWLGMLEIGQKSGLINKAAKLCRPILKWLFPSVPADHPAASAILMNLSANFLGMGNAATPFGLQAMKHLQELNHNSKKASTAMCTLLAVNAAGLTLIPSTVLGLRIAAGSMNQEKILPAIILTSATGFIAALILDRWFRYKEGDL